MNEQKCAEYVSNLRNMNEINSKAIELVEILNAYNEDHKAIAKINVKADGLSVNEILLSSREMNRVMKILLELCMIDFKELKRRNDEDISKELKEVIDKFDGIEET